MAACAFILFLLAVGSWSQKACSASTFGFEFHHRFSDRVRQWAESVDGGAWHWPEKGSVEYYAALVDHDRVLRGRMLAGTNPPLTFVTGNKTVQVNRLGYLHYAEVSVGTPSTTFFVALDTGSDLFWLPCDCKSCAPTSSANYGLGSGNFSIYSPASSSSSERVPCSSTYCERQSQCSGAENQCPYLVRYVSENTSTSGVLLQDVLHLVTDDSQGKTVEAKIIIGCGQTQTGHFLTSAAPNGLFGLGLDPVSVPSVLAKAGITSNSFSMCFGNDGVGRIRFGDQGSSDQAETPFTNDPRQHPTYFVTVTGIQIGSTSTGINGTYRVIMDSGTSFTYLTDPVYSFITKAFDAGAQDPRVILRGSPFEYCYSVRQQTISLPVVSLTMKGGKEFQVLDPIIVVSGGPGVYFYCLAVTKSENYDIIGQNFMKGLRVVFDREKLVLGWKEFKCYDRDNSSSSVTVKPTAPTAVGLAPTSFSPQETVNGNGTRVNGGASGLSPRSLSAPLDWLTLPLLSLVFVAGLL